ncbi:4-alpha-glucanotransferase [Cereibacter sp. SYSU M97828]|nr:4-alpha-glucanotransferase [Cereibacter flavus]
MIDADVADRSFEELKRLCAAAGLERTFLDATGVVREASPETLWKLLEAVGREGTMSGSPAMISAPGARLDLPTEARDWTLVDEGGAVLDASVAPDVGRYRLSAVMTDEGTFERTLIVSSGRCWLPEQRKYPWGIAIQLYQLRSDENWGIGDFSDLRCFARIASGLGASMIGLNPLHAMFLDRPEQASPYSPSCRHHLNVLYIDVTAIDGFDSDPAAREIVANDRFVERLCACRRAALVDYAEVAALKLPVLETLFARFLRQASAEEMQQFDYFLAERGETLQRFCRYEALREVMTQHGAGGDWTAWPDRLDDCLSEAVERFAAVHANRVAFFGWMQWIADTQLAQAAAEAKDAGMEIGLYRDLAVSADRQGAEAWGNPGRFLPGADIGAPPDPLGPTGQNWGLPPLHPREIEGFGQLIRANMRHAGALRIDHVMALQQLYLIPHGFPTDAGAYLRYPTEELLAVLAAESERQQCIVIGEDLGTVPEGFRERMAAARILSYRVVQFERRIDGTLIPPGKYPRLSLSVLGSHDLPTLNGWWTGNDIQVRVSLGLYGQPDDERLHREQRAQERDILAHAFGLEDGSPADQLPIAAHEFLARTASMLMIAQLDDLLGEADQVNLPGSNDEHPNWRRKYSRDLNSIALDAGLSRLAGRMSELREERVLASLRFDDPRSEGHHP